MVKNTKQFRTSLQEDDLPINRVVAKVPWCLSKERCGNHACSLCLCRVHAEGTKPFLSPLSSPQPNECVLYKCSYLHSLNVHNNFGTNAQNDKNSAFLTLSVLQIINPKGKGDFPVF